jgi:cell division transport system ATP-binding protein
MIKFSDVSKSYEKAHILKNLTFTIDKGELTYITGPSGAGKSTLLKLIYCSENPDSGQIIVDDWVVSKLKHRTIPYFRRNIGIVFQDFKLLNNKTVFENVALSLRIHRMDSNAIRESVNAVLKDVSMLHKAKDYPQFLSGGEQQRVVVARAMVTKPMLLLADEPTGNLDDDNSRHIMKLFREVNAKGTTVIIATHDMGLYQGSGRRVLFIKDRYIEKEIIG